MRLRRVVHVATEAGPVGIGGLVRQRRDVGEVGVLLGERHEFFVVVELVAGALTIDQGDRQRAALLQQVEDHRARARQARAARHEDRRRVHRLAHEEAAIGAGDLDAVARLELFVEVGGAHAARDDANVELNLAAGGRHVGEREGTADVEAGKVNVDVLASLKMNRLVEFDEDRLDGRRQRFDARHRAGEIPHRDGFGVRLLVDLGLDGHVALQAGAAGQGLALVTLEVHGKPWSTEQLAVELDRWRLDSRTVNFMVGGPEGLAPEVCARADQRWSLSALTLPHPLVRILIGEQLYRAWTVLSGHPYHK